jgi:hypothetical protein
MPPASSSPTAEMASSSCNPAVLHPAAFRPDPAQIRPDLGLFRPDPAQIRPDLGLMRPDPVKFCGFFFVFILLLQGSFHL